MKFCVSTLKSSYSPDTSFPYPLLPCPCKGLGTKLVYTGVRYEQCSSSLALCINMYRVWSYSYYHRLQLCSSKNIIAAVLSMVCQFFQIVPSYCSFECIVLIRGGKAAILSHQPQCSYRFVFESYSRDTWNPNLNILSNFHGRFS